jgi:integrase
MPKRRGSGDGSIHQRKDGRWVAVIDRGTVAGKRQREYLYGETRKEVAEKLKLAQRQTVAPKHIDARMHLYAYTTMWLEQVIKPNNTHNTYMSYRTDIQYATAVLGHYQLNKLQPQHVQAWLTKQLETHAVRSVRRMRGTLISALANATKWGYIDRNVASLTIMPKITPFQITTLTREQVQLFIQTAKGTRLEALFVLAVLLGQRKGEYLALQWSDVDFDNATLRINKTLYYKNGVPYAGNTKTKTDRMLPLSPGLITVLREHQERQRKEPRDEAYQDQGYVFTLLNGKPLYTSHVRREFQTLLDTAGLPRIRFHDLRHTCATLLIEAGVSLTIVSALLGHASIKTTSDIYAHISDNALLNSTMHLERFLVDP